MSYVNGLESGTHFKKLQLNSVTELDTEFYEKMIEASPRLESLELSARFSYDWCSNILKKRRGSNSLKSLSVFIHEKSIDDLIDLVDSSPRLRKLSINGLMHENRSDETDLVPMMAKLTAKLPVLSEFKMRIRTHLIPDLLPISGHLITELLVDGDNESVYVTGNQVN